jgi:hypothetical protein
MPFVKGGRLFIKSGGIKSGGRPFIEGRRRLFVEGGGRSST